MNEIKDNKPVFKDDADFSMFAESSADEYDLEPDKNGVLLKGKFNSRPNIFALITGFGLIIAVMIILCEITFDYDSGANGFFGVLIGLIGVAVGFFVIRLLSCGRFRVYEDGVRFRTLFTNKFYSFDNINHAATETILARRRNGSVPYVQLTIYMKGGYAVYTDADLSYHTVTLSELKSKEKSGGFGVLCNYINAHAKLKK